jgi:hypothetical protein
VKIAAVSALAAAALLAAPLGRTQEPPMLVGTVRPGFTIDLADATGRHVDLLKEGAYTLLVHDQSDIHNFVLGKKETGERAASTEVEFVGDPTFPIKLTPGHWVYACSPHFQTMFGSFVVVRASTQITPVTPAKAKTLTARLTASGATLSARRISAGRYAITVVDRSKTRGFRLVGPGVDRRTSAAFVGTTVWNVRLARGTYRFGTGLPLAGRLVVT